jgi:outer membrane protein assembly factor BamB
LYTDEGRTAGFGGSLCALHVDDGHTVWRRTIGPHNYTTPVVVGDMALLSDTVNGQLLALNVVDGEERWRFQTGPSLQCTAPDRRDVPSISSTPAVAGGIVYVGASDGNLYAVDLETGAEISRTGLGAAIASSPAFSGNALLVATCDDALYCLCGDGDPGA